jgi:hypothetical protein
MTNTTSSSVDGEPFPLLRLGNRCLGTLVHSHWEAFKNYRSEKIVRSSFWCAPKVSRNEPYAGIILQGGAEQAVALLACLFLPAIGLAAVDTLADASDGG